ncbi:MAG: hypothetical protein IMW91_04680 [Firmicutes bacterium]|nr:hypothetical protein [Bacillota bacterium]
MSYPKDGGGVLLSFVLAEVGLWVGWWWLFIVGGLASGLIPHQRHPFWSAFVGTFLAWAVMFGVRLWKESAWGQATVTAHLAGLPGISGALFMLLPTWLAAVAAGLFCFAVMRWQGRKGQKPL